MQNLSVSSECSDFIVDQESFFIGKDTALTNPIHLLKYDKDLYQDKLYSKFSIERPSSFEDWVSIRRAQFLAGRIAANIALAAINENSETNNQNISIGQFREPLWPIGFIGSISHSNDISVAVAYRKSKSTMGIGIDIQAILNEEEIYNTRSLVLTESDHVFLDTRPKKISYEQLFTLIFSSKESFFKAVFNSVGAYFDFDDVSVHLVNYASKYLTLKCNVSLSKHIKKDDEFKVSFNDPIGEALHISTCCIA